MIRGRIGESREDGPEEEGITSGTGQLHSWECGVTRGPEKKKGKGSECLSFRQETSSPLNLVDVWGSSQTEGWRGG